MFEPRFCLPLSTVQTVSRSFSLALTFQTLSLQISFCLWNIFTQMFFHRLNLNTVGEGIHYLFLAQVFYHSCCSCICQVENLGFSSSLQSSPSLGCYCYFRLKVRDLIFSVQIPAQSAWSQPHCLSAQVPLLTLPVSVQFMDIKKTYRIFLFKCHLSSKNNSSLKSSLMIFFMCHHNVSLFSVFKYKYLLTCYVSQIR